MEVDMQVDSLTEYFSKYSKEFQCQRLVFASKLLPKELEHTCLIQAIDLVKQTFNVDLFAELSRSVGSSVDTHWVRQANSTYHEGMSKLLTALETEKRTLRPELVLAAITRIAELHYTRGEYSSAMSRYQSALEHCSNASERTELCYSIVKTGFLCDQFAQVNAISSRELQDSPSLTPLQSSGFNATLGISALRSGSFANAVEYFSKVTKDVEFASLREIALYAGLSALAGCSRDQVKEWLDNPAFRDLLRNHTSIKESVMLFYKTQYHTAMEQLAGLRPVMSIDPVLSRCSDRMLSMVRNTALVQYTKPYGTLNFSSISSAFNTPVDVLMKEIKALIEEGSISARIDSVAEVLVKYESDPRIEAMNAASEVMEDYLRTAELSLLTMQMLKHGIIVGKSIDPIESSEVEDSPFIVD